MPLTSSSRFARFTAVLATGLLVAILALFVFAPGVAQADEGCGWHASYWNNRDLQGNAQLTRCDTAIDFDWHGLSPDPSIAVDNFSARWQRTYHFAAGTYRFQATMDDGMQVFIDGKKVISDWQEGNVRTLEADLNLGGGPHDIVVEYFEKGGNAIAGFTWFRLDGQPMPPTGKPQPMPPAPMPPSMMPPMDSGVIYPVAEVKSPFLNVRSGPGVSNPVVAVLKQHTEVLMLARSSGGTWIQIATDGVNGWVNRYYLATDFPFTSLTVAGTPGTGGPAQPVPPPPAPKPVTIVNTSALNVRSGPGVQYNTIAVVFGGTQVEVVGQNPNGWTQIRIPGSVTGWVNGSYLSTQ